MIFFQASLTHWSHRNHESKAVTTTPLHSTLNMAHSFQSQIPSNSLYIINPHQNVYKKNLITSSLYIYIYIKVYLLIFTGGPSGDEHPDLCISSETANDNWLAVGLGAAGGIGLAIICFALLCRSCCHKRNSDDIHVPY